MSEDVLRMKPQPGYHTATLATGRSKLDPRVIEIPQGFARVHEADHMLCTSLPAPDGPMVFGLVVYETPISAEAAEALIWTLTADTARTLASKLLQLADIIERGVGRQ